MKYTLAGLALLFCLWAWACIYYLLVGLDVSLARPWTVVGSLPIIMEDPYLMRRAAIAAGTVSVAALLLVITAFRDRAKGDFGNARFAMEPDIRRAGLRATAGLILGKYKGKYLVDDGQTHVLVAAPTGSGKGVGVVIPNLLNWNGSTVVLDIKGENFDLTSGMRHSHGQRIIRFSPFLHESHRFNPFDVINTDPRHRYNDIENIAQILLPDNEKDPTWSQQGRALFTAFALYLLDHDEQACTIGNILRYLQTADDTRDIAKGIVRAEGERLDPAAQRIFSNFMQQEKRMSESVKVGLVGALSLWNSSSIDAATSGTDFDPATLRSSRTSIYVVISLADLQAIRPLLTLFFEQVFATQLRTEPGPQDKHKVLFLLDEFESLGTMSGIVDKLPFVRSFGIRVMAIIQGLSQLDQRYGAAGRDKILQASRHQIYFASNDQQTTEYVSSLLGRKTIVTKSTSHSRQGRTTSRQAQTRELMLPQEVRELSTDKLLLVTEGTPPVLGNKIRYFKDAALKARVGKPTPDIPALDLSPRPSPTLEDVAGSALAADIRAEKQGGAPGGGGGMGKSPKSAPAAPVANTFGDLIGKLDQKAATGPGQG